MAGQAQGVRWAGHAVSRVTGLIGLPWFPASRQGMRSGEQKQHPCQGRLRCGGDAGGLPVRLRRKPILWCGCGVLPPRKGGGFLGMDRRQMGNESLRVGGKASVLCPNIWSVSNGLPTGGDPSHFRRMRTRGCPRAEAHSSIRMVGPERGGLLASGGVSYRNRGVGLRSCSARGRSRQPMATGTV